MAIPYFVMVLGAFFIGLTADGYSEIVKLLGLAFIIIGAIKNTELK